MLAARCSILLCRAGGGGTIGTAGFSAPAKWANVRQMASEARSGVSRHLERRARPTLKERALGPASSSAFNAGQGVVAGASVLGLGALAYYGLGMANEMGAVDRAVVWPQYVRDRVRDTYGYFAVSLPLTAASAVAVFRTPALINMVSRGGLMAFGVSIAALIGSGMVVRSIPYQQGLGVKQLAWAVHCGVVGAVIAPICFLGGPLLIRAAWYTAGMVGGLSTVAACAPSDKFLAWGGPLSMGLGVVFMSSLASSFLPPTTALGAGVYSIAIYGGLVLFGGFLLYDTQKIIQRAEATPQYQVFDPVNASISIYMDTINIFIRIAQILAMQGGKRK